MTRYWMRFVFAVSMAALSAQGQQQRTHADLEELVENHQWPQASSLAEQRLKASPNDARLQWLAAEVRFAYRDLDRAAKLAEQAAAGDPDNANYQFALFEIYGSQAEKASLFRQPGLARKAKKAVDRALELDPKHAKALFGSMIYLYRAPSLVWRRQATGTGDSGRG